MGGPAGPCETRDLDRKERLSSVLLLGLDGESTGDAGLRLRLNVVFQSISVRRGHLAPSDYFIATTGGSASVSAADAEVIKYTPSATISVEHVASHERESGGSFQLSPKVKSGAKDAERTVELGSMQLGGKEKVTSEMKFLVPEMLLVATNLGNEVQWKIDSHRSEKTVRDFLVGNVSLEATFRWGSVTKLESQPAPAENAPPNLARSPGQSR
jgi:hypothetical protein